MYSPTPIALNHESIHIGIIEGVTILTDVFTTTFQIPELLEEKNHSVKAWASGLSLAGLGLSGLAHSSLRPTLDQK